MQLLDQGDDQAVGQHQEGGDGIHDHAVRHDAGKGEGGGREISFETSIISNWLYNKTQPTMMFYKMTVHFTFAHSLQPRDIQQISQPSPVDVEFLGRDMAKETCHS